MYKFSSIRKILKKVESIVLNQKFLAQVQHYILLHIDKISEYHKLVHLYNDKIKCHIKYNVLNQKFNFHAENF